MFSHVLLGLQVIAATLGIGLGVFIADVAKSRAEFAVGFSCALAGVFLLVVHIVGLLLT